MATGLSLQPMLQDSHSPQAGLSTTAYTWDDMGHMSLDAQSRSAGRK